MADPLGSVPGIVVGVGVGAAASAALAPAIELPKQTAWAQNPNRILDVGLLARLVAQGAISLGDAYTAGKRDGYDTDKVDALVYLSQTVPGFAQVLDLWRRDLIGTDLVQHALTKEGVDQRYVDQLLKLKTAEIIPPPDLAYMVIRDLVPDPYGYSGPTGPNDHTISDIPQLDIDVLAEAAKSGWDPLRFEALVGRSGLAPAPVFAAQAYFRKIISWEQFKTIIGKGDLRPAYTNVVLEGSRQILTADQYLEGALRGWISFTDGVDGAKKHGMSEDDAKLLYEIRRRPLTPHTITEALAKGGVFNPAPGEIQDPYDAAVHQQDLGPEWYDLAKAMKYSPPSLFVIRQLLKDGAYSPDHAELRIRQLGIFPEDAALIAKYYAPTGGATADPHVTKAENQLWTATHRAYIAGEVTNADATNSLQTAGVKPDAIPAILGIWGAERLLVRQGLTAANIHKAYNKGATNDATGQPWTRDEAIAALVALRYDPAEAGQYLDIP